MRQFRQLGLFDKLANYKQSKSGAFAAWAALTAPVMIGGAALSVDLSRMYNMNQDLQVAADALARAGAAELDQRSDAHVRANRAIDNLVSNDQKFGAEGAGIVVKQEVRYFKDLPRGEKNRIGKRFETNDPREAKYVEVTVKPQKLDVIFPPNVLKAIAPSVVMEAKAIAGSEQSVCNVAPVFICNPYEGTDVSLYEALESEDYRPRQIRFETANCGYKPGNFGYINSRGSTCSRWDTARSLEIAKDFGKVTPTVCISKSAGITIKHGGRDFMEQAFNTRFDMYSGKFCGMKNDEEYAPAKNVVKGRVAKKYYNGYVDACNTYESNSAQKFPRDNCLNNGTCPDGRNIGDGEWDVLKYMEVNHDAMSQINLNGTLYRFDYNNKTVSPSDPMPSRYDIYRWEIDNDCIPGALTYGNSAQTNEEGIPRCNKTVVGDDVDRRIIYAAVLNCNALEETIGLDGSEGTVPIEGFAKVFVTEPMDTRSGGSYWNPTHTNVMYGEIVGSVVEGVDTVSRDNVSIFR